MRSGSASSARSATTCGCSPSSPSAHSSSPRTTSSWAEALFHDTVWFSLAWGAFPALTAYFTEAGELRAEAFLVAAYAFLLSFAQRRLSTVVRTVRRNTRSVTGTVEYDDGRSEPIDAETLIRAPESALQLLAGATAALALALLLLHV